MTAEFLPLDRARLHARSLDRGAVPFVVAAMFTPNLRERAERLKKSLDDFSLNHAIYEVPTIHRSISPKGNDDLAFSKPNFIRNVVEEYRLPVLYLDADVVVRERPEEIFACAQRGIDFAIYNWLAEIDTDCFAPLEVETEKGLNSSFYVFSHSCDLFDPAQLVASGAVQYYGPNAEPLLSEWLEATARFPGVVDDELLSYAHNYPRASYRLDKAWLPKSYCRYPWWIYARPVIEHPEWPATTEPGNRFKAHAGRPHYRPESAKVMIPEGPFPRDCLIDTGNMGLYRIDEDGTPIFVRDLAGQLWMSAP
jgi:hypothetical protein